MAGYAKFWGAWKLIYTHHLVAGPLIILPTTKKKKGKRIGIRSHFMDTCLFWLILLILDFYYSSFWYVKRITFLSPMLLSSSHCRELSPQAGKALSYILS